MPVNSSPQTAGPACQFKEKPVAVELRSDVNLTYPVFPFVLKVPDMSCEKQMVAISGSDPLDPSLKKTIIITCRAYLQWTSVSIQHQCCAAANNTSLIENNGVAPE